MQCMTGPDLLSAVNISSNMGDDITGLSGTGGAKLDSLPPHGVQLGRPSCRGMTLLNMMCTPASTCTHHITP